MPGPTEDSRVEDLAKAKPTGEGDLVVGEADCIASIADTTGHFWETIWNHPANAALKEARKDPNILLAGDRVTVPPIRPLSVDRPTGQRHVFRRRGIPSRLTIRILENDRPRANEPYKLIVDSRVKSGTTDAGGVLSVWISARASQATLTVGTGVSRTDYELGLRHLRPSHDLIGAQQRLSNLGFECLDEQGLFGEATRAAVAAFQRFSGFPATGQLDTRTLDALSQAHGS